MDLFKEVARVLKRANGKEASVKTLVYNESSYPNLRQLFALSSECMKFQGILEKIISQCGSQLLDEEMIGRDKFLAVVLLYEYLVGKGFGHNAYVRRVIVRHKAAIRSGRDDLLKTHNCRSLRDIIDADQVSTRVPRYARVNLVKCTVQEAIDQLQLEGWIYNGPLQTKSFRQEIESFDEYTFGLDPLLNDLLVFSIGTDLHSHPLVLSGVLVLQDKASCIPAHALNPQPGAVVLDCCAAPGNKTCHLASLMGDKGRVIAIDRDRKRFTTMGQLLDRSGLNCINLINQDFLDISPTNPDASQIELILVDPSCSGSGMAGRRMCVADSKVDVGRLESLKRFQITLLKHALRFPNAQRVVYSTCSVHQEENEEVVEEVMANVKEFFQFKPIFPELTDCRGIKKFLHYNDFLRLSAEKNMTNGFFVACFERIKSAQKAASNGDEALDSSEAAGSNKMEEEEDCDSDKVKKSKKKKKKREKSPEEIDVTVDNNNTHLSSTEVDGNNESSMLDESEHSKKKKKKKREKSPEEIDVTVNNNNTHLSSTEVDGNNESSMLLDESEHSKKKKKKKREKSSDRPSVTANDDNLHLSNAEVNGNDESSQSDLLDVSEHSKIKKKKSKKEKHTELSNTTTDGDQTKSIINTDVQSDGAEESVKRKAMKKSKSRRKEKEESSTKDTELIDTSEGAALPLVNESSVDRSENRYNRKRKLEGTSDGIESQKKKEKKAKKKKMENKDEEIENNDISEVALTEDHNGKKHKHKKSKKDR